MKSPIKIAITGAAGQISYSLLFRIASGDMLGQDQPVILQLLEVESAISSLNGVLMELEDCAYPLLSGVIITHDPYVAFKDADIAILVGARPRSKGMERKDLLEANGAIFSVQGKALSEVASKHVKVLVVGNPANTNALITQKNAPNLDPKNITAMMRLDHNRTLSQLAKHTCHKVSDIKKVIVWGNHSATQCPDINHATINNKPAVQLVTEDWCYNTLIPAIQKRGAIVIEARGASSAASAANAAIDHIRSWVLGTKDGEWVSMGIPSDGSYGIPEGVIYGFPVTCKSGEYKIVKGLNINDKNKELMQKTYLELLEEKQSIKHLLGE